MAKVSASALWRPQRTIIDRILTAKAANGEDTVGIPLTCRMMSVAEWAAVSELSNERKARHITGVGDPAKKGYRAPSPLIPVQGQPLYPSGLTIMVATALEYAQVCEDDGDRYSFEELMAFTAIDALCGQMIEFMNDLQPPEDLDPKENPA